MVTFTDFAAMHKKLNINTSDLGCVMLDFESLGDSIIPEEWLYNSPNPEHFWLTGWRGFTPHVTLKYGLLQQAEAWKDYILELLADWEPEDAEPMGTIAFPSPYPDEPYVCLAAGLFLSPNLEDAHRRLSYLPHIDTFSPYLPHVTIANVRPEWVEECRALIDNQIVGQKFRPTFINLGSDKS